MSVTPPSDVQQAILDIGDTSKPPFSTPPTLHLSTPAAIGRCYARAAVILRSKSHFPLSGLRGTLASSRLPHIVNPSRTTLHPDAQLLALDIEAVAMQAIGELGNTSISTEFVINLEAFACIHVDEYDDYAVAELALAYEPVRLDTFLRYTTKGSTSRFFNQLAARPMQRTSQGVRIVKRDGLITGLGVVVLCLLPVLFYVYRRAGIADTEKVIQVSITIMAATLLSASGPMHRMLYNNWDLREALSLRMTLNEDTMHNVHRKDQRYVGLGLVANGEMDMISGDVGYASPFSKRGVNPGPLTLSVLTYYREHWVVVDQDGRLLLLYRGETAVELMLRGTPDRPMPLKGTPCDLPRNYYVLNVGLRPVDYMVGFAAENCLVE